jgi:TolB protein
MTPMLLVLQVAHSVVVAPESGEVHLRNVRQLTFGGQNAEAYFAASGRLLIFQRQGGGPAEQCDQMYVMRVDGSDLHRVSSGRGRTTCGYFYDRDRRIFYSSTEHGDPSCPPRPDYSHGYVWALYDYDIYTANADGSDPRRLTTNPGYDAEATLSPDGSTIVFTSLRDGDLDVYTMRVDGTQLKRLTTTLGYDGGPFFSPDGKLIVYRAYHPATAADSAEYLELLARRLVRPTRMDLWIMNADGSDQRQVTHLPGASFAPSFFPDGRRIIFASNFSAPTSEHFDLYALSLDGTGLEPITTDHTFNAFPMFSPDGRELVWASNRHGRAPHETNIFIADWVERGGP